MIHRIAAQDNPFLTLQYDSVVIYDFEWRTKYASHLSIIDNGKLASTVTKSARLKKKEAAKLVRLMGDSLSYGKSEAACFEPHLGIVFYREGKFAEYITICIDCNRLVPSIRIPAQEQGKQQTEEGDIYFIGKGMSKPFRKHLDSLLKKYDFSHRIRPGISFEPD